jgi:hypothetical protein
VWGGAPSSSMCREPRTSACPLVSLHQVYGASDLQWISSVFTIFAIPRISLSFQSNITFLFVLIIQEFVVLGISKDT